MRFDAAGAFITVLMVSACAVVSPLTNPRMTGAPHQACAAVNGRIEPADRGTVPMPPQCFALAVLEPDGRRSSWGGGLLEPGRSLLAIHRPGPGCNGTFTHLTVEGAAAAGGRMELASWDLHARPGHSRVVRWEQGFATRTFALADIGSTLMNPAGARITVQQGAFDPHRICFKSY